MTYLPILCTTLALTITQTYLQKTQSWQKESQPYILNKNVNIIVNVNANELAEELWKVIEARLSNGTSHTNARSTIKELKKAVIPFISPTRRGATTPSIFHLASQFDKITRRALIRNAPAINMLDEEILVRDIVADMIASLKMQISKIIQLKAEEIDDSAFNRRTMNNPIAINNDDQNDYVDVRIKMRKQDIIDAFN